MEKHTLGKTGIQVTPVGFGVLTVGRTQLNLPVREGAALLRYALERGVNFLDTAQYYRTYPYIREALRGTRFEPVIVSKSLHGDACGMRDAIEEARRELDRDVIDVFLLHELRHGGDFANRRGAFEALCEAKAKGLVRAVGASTHHIDVAERMAKAPEMDVLFALINYKGLGVRRGAGPGTKEEMAAAVKKASEAGLGVFAMKVFGGGNLVGDYLTALDYVSKLPGIDSMMLGIGRRDEVDRMIEYAEGRIDRSYRPDTSEKKIRVDQGDCEGCGACIGRCPNRALRFNSRALADVDYDLCLRCGYCAPVCPTRAIVMF
ncbi:MAG: aldo/keto reductase [Clostridiales Family XIII bacterium]|jgi:aryl-alcohol dehydrogenase-like predicted oxidoreductase/ferredoxin|nr:aldo/keto reductase [Clostridiales Family XIII bacterium]